MERFHTRRTKQSRQEEGSLLLALLAILIIGGLVTVLMAATVTGQRQVQFDRNFSGAINPASSGIDAATTWINTEEADQGGVVADPSTQYTRNGAVDPDGGYTFTWTASKVNDQRWEITSVGTAPDGTTRTVEASVVPRPLFQFAAFAKTNVGLGGGNSADSYDPYGDPQLDTGRGIVGSNGIINIDNNSTAQNTDGVELHNYDDDDTLESRIVGNCADCPQFRVFVEDGGKLYGVFEKPLVFDTWWIDRTMSTLRDSRPGSTYNTETARANGTDYCNSALASLPFDHTTTMPDAIEFRKDQIAVTIDGSPQTYLTSRIPGGAYCAKGVSFAGDSKDFIDPLDSGSPDKKADGDSRDDIVIYTDGDITVAHQMRVNCGNPGFTCEAGIPLAVDMQVYSTGDNLLIENQTDFAGLIYAPEAVCKGTSSNASVDIYGAVVCDTLENVGGWSFHFDESSREVVTQEYELDEWREEPTGSSF